jgi:gamma-glutamylcyclotransferase
MHWNGHEVYFAYGSNMSSAQMKERCPSARDLGAAKLPGHRLTFPRSSETRGGGVAGIEPAPGSAVEGVLYSLSPEDLSRLDDFEGTDEGRYRRGRVEVDHEGEPRQVWTYYALPEGDRFHPPSRDYLETMIRGAEEHGLADTLDRLRGLIA